MKLDGPADSGNGAINLRAFAERLARDHADEPAGAHAARFLKRPAASVEGGEPPTEAVTGPVAATIDLEKARTGTHTRTVAAGVDATSLGSGRKMPDLPSIAEHAPSSDLATHSFRDRNHNHDGES